MRRHKYKSPIAAVPLDDRDLDADTGSFAGNTPIRPNSPTVQEDRAGTAQPGYQPEARRGVVSGQRLVATARKVERSLTCPRWRA
jgi:hypothetical protein